jgi:hypothetical protein
VRRRSSQSASRRTACEAEAQGAEEILREEGVEETCEEGREAEGWRRASVSRRTDSREEGEEGREEERGAGELNNQDELLNRRVAETIERVGPDIPEPLRPYLVYRGPMPESLKANWFPRELTIEAPGREPQRVEVYQDSCGFLYARIYEAK